MRFTKEIIRKEFDRIIIECGNFPATLLRRKDFQANCGRVGSRSYGECNTIYNFIWINSIHPDIGELRNTIYHEILHCTFPKHTEEWINQCASKLNREGGSWLYTSVPSREMILNMIKQVN